MAHIYILDLYCPKSLSTSSTMSPKETRGFANFLFSFCKPEWYTGRVLCCAQHLPFENAKLLALKDVHPDPPSPPTRLPEIELWQIWKTLRISYGDKGVISISSDEPALDVQRWFPAFRKNTDSTDYIILLKK